jgi:hypothetical protein
MPSALYFANTERRMNTSPRTSTAARGLERAGHVADLPGVGRDVLAGDPVAAGDGAHQDPLGVVVERARDAVELGHHHRVADEARGPLVEVLVGVALVEREHRDLVLDPLARERRAHGDEHRVVGATAFRASTSLSKS